MIRNVFEGNKFKDLINNIKGFCVKIEFLFYIYL